MEINMAIVSRPATQEYRDNWPFGDKPEQKANEVIAIGQVWANVTPARTRFAGLAPNSNIGTVFVESGSENVWYCRCVAGSRSDGWSFFLDDDDLQTGQRVPALEGEPARVLVNLAMGGRLNPPEGK
jgi:hypothetical protein